jgi:chromosome segregation ATPase
MKEASMSTKELEKKSLEAHVELCAERYESVERKLTSLEGRMDKIEEHIVEVKNKLTSSVNSNNLDSYKTIITIGTSVFGVLLTAVLGILVHLATK